MPIRIVTIGALFFGAAMAFAHSEQSATIPADGATITEVPATIALRFTEGMRLTKVDLIHAEAQAEPVDLGDQAGFATEIRLPLPAKGPGLYRIEWRGLGVDGHPMTGSFSFEVE